MLISSPRSRTFITGHCQTNFLIPNVISQELAATNFVHIVDRYLMIAFFFLYCHEMTCIYFYYEMYRVNRNLYLYLFMNILFFVGFVLFMLFNYRCLVSCCAVRYNFQVTTTFGSSSLPFVLEGVMFYLCYLFVYLFT